MNLLPPYTGVGRPLEVCSNACRDARRQKCKEKGCGNPAYARGVCRNHYRRARTRARLAWTANRECPTCGAHFAPKKKSQKYCCSSCQIKGNARTYVPLRRARLKQVSSVAVDTTEILERDRWKCRLCGVKTPRSLRGTADARAPQVDHIIPISKGGPHSHENLQCLCRACNLRKSDAPLGQLWLIGGEAAPKCAAQAQP